MVRNIKNVVGLKLRKWLLKGLCVFLTLAPLLSLSAFSKDHFIDEYFTEFNHPNKPGAAVLVFQNREIIFEKGYGLANIAKHLSVASHTNFRLASLSKQFTATAILLLVQQKRLSLDTPIDTFFPNLPIYASKITVRHLLNHTSGLYDYEDLISSSQTQQVSDRDVLSLLEQKKTTYFNSGSQYRYSNGGYVLLGLIVEQVTQQNFASFLKDHIFSPLQMTSSLMYDGSDTIINNRALGYTASGNSFKETDQNVTSATRGDGGVYTSTQDWIRWELSIQDNLIISKELQQMALTPGKLNNGSLTNYGFGWMLDTFKGLTHQYHTGSTIGFRTAIERFPEKELTVLVLVNRANASPWTIARNIAEHYFYL